MKFLLILSIVTLVWFAVSLLGVYAMNEDLQNKLHRRRFHVPSWLTFMAVLSATYIIYWFVQ